MMQLQGFESLQTLSQGMIKKIYLAKHIPRDKVFLIKSYSKKYLQNCVEFEQFLREYIAAFLPIKNKSIAVIHSVIETHGTYQFVCQYYEDGNLLSLQTLRPQKVWTFGQSLSIIVPIIDALKMNESRKRKQLYSLQPEDIFVKKLCEKDLEAIIKKSEPQLYNFQFFLHQPTCPNFWKISPLEDIRPTLQNQPPEAWKTPFTNFEKYHIWKIGLLLCYLLNAQYPFESNTVEELQSKASSFSYCRFVRMTKRKRYEYCNWETQLFFKKIFHPDPQQRLGYSQIKQHSLFRARMKIPSSIISYDDQEEDQFKKIVKDEKMNIVRKLQSVAFILWTLKKCEKMNLEQYELYPLKYNLLLYTSHLFVHKIIRRHDLEKLKYQYYTNNPEKISLPQRKTDYQRMNPRQFYEEFSFLFNSFTKIITQPIDEQIQKVKKKCIEKKKQILERNDYFYFHQNGQVGTQLQKSYKKSISRVYQKLSAKRETVKLSKDEDNEILEFCLLTCIWFNFDYLIFDKHKNLHRMFVKCFSQKEGQVNNFGMQFFFVWIQKISRKDKTDIINYLQNK